jgi:protein gp37
MADKTHIEWTNATWNPITGCSIVSPGCTNCYAMRMAGTWLRHHPSRAGLTTMSKAGPVWNGQVRLNDEWLAQPLRWRRPRLIFVCAHGDLFHEDVPDEWIDRVFAVMARAPQHTFQVLTKRPARMREYLMSFRGDGQGFLTRNGKDGLTSQSHMPPHRFPLPNVWLGTSVEDQPRADKRIPDLLATPAAARFISYEPALGPVDFRRIDDCSSGTSWVPRWCNALDGTVVVEHPAFPDPLTDRPRIDWVICGGESGPGARPMHPAWARSVRDQCEAAGVAFFMKQLSGPKGRAIKDIAAFPEDLQVREYPR